MRLVGFWPTAPISGVQLSDRFVLGFGYRSAIAFLLGTSRGVTRSSH